MPWSRSPARPLLLLLLSAGGLGCRPETAVRGAPGPADPAVLDSADSGRSGDTGAPPVAEGCRVVDVQPRTVSDAAETGVHWSLVCDSLRLGDEAWSLSVGDTVLPLDAAAADGTVVLTAQVPADGLGPGWHDLGSPAVAGRPLDGLGLSVRVHATEDAVAAALRGTGWNSWAGSPQESRSFYLGDPDGNRVLDLLSTAVLADGTVVQHAQQANGEGAFQDRRGLAHVEADGFVSGEGFWFESDTEGLLSLVAATEPGEVAHVRKSTFVGRDWTESVLRVNHGFMGVRVPDVLLAAEPEWYAPEDLLMNLLGIVDRGSGPVGLYCEGSVCWEWTQIGGLTPAEVAAGRGFLGSFTDGELGALQPASSHPKFWSLDARTPGEGLQLSVIDYDYHTENWSVARGFSLPDPGFAVQAVSGAGQDLDGDGSWELLVELWGEGGWQAWLIRGADDKQDDRPPLLLGSSDRRALWGSPAPAPAGASVLVPSTFVANGRALRSTRLLADAPSVETADAALVVVEEWSLAAVLDGTVETAAPERGAVVGRVDLGPTGACAGLQGAPLPACRRGMLPQSVAAAGTEGASGPLDPYWDGDLLLLAPGEGQDRVLVSRGLHPAGVSPGWLAALGAVPSADVRVGWDAGLRLVVEDEDHGALCHGTVQVAVHPSGRVVAGQDPTDCEEGTTTLWWPDGSTQRLSVPDGDAPRGVTLLSPEPMAEGTWPALWTSAAGQTLLGTLVLSPDAAPSWVGDPQRLAADEAAVPLSLGEARRGAVVLRPGQERAWPAPSVAGETRGASLSLALEEPVVVALVAASGEGCAWQTAVLPAADAGGDPGVLFESEDPACEDLPVPLAAGRLDGTQEVLVSATAAGDLVVSRFAGTEVRHQSVALELAAGAANRAVVSTGDLNGDALDDLLVARLEGHPALVLLSDGQGGWLSSDGVSASGGGRNVAGLASPAPGRPAPHGVWSGAPDALQRVVVPVAAP